MRALRFAARRRITIDGLRWATKVGLSRNAFRIFARRKRMQILVRIRGMVPPARYQFGDMLRTNETPSTKRFFQSQAACTLMLPTTTLRAPSG
jgi:hypothetical protein